MSKLFLGIFLLICFIISNSQGAKILFFFAGGSYSHKSSVWAWASELANRDHEITFLSAHSKKPTDHPKIRDISTAELNKVMTKTYSVDRFTERRDGKEQDMFGTYGPISIKTCRALLQSKNDPVLQHLIHNSTFDLVVVNIIYGECGFLLAHNYKSKTIVYDASVPLPFFYDVYGFLPQSSWIPDPLHKYKNFPMNFLERFLSSFKSIYWYWDRCNIIYPSLETLMKEAFNLEESPSVLEMERRASLVFINTHPAVDFAYSLPPMFNMIGGLQMWAPEKPIPDKYQTFMDTSGPNGVILISFGSTVDLEKVPVFYQHVFFNLAKKHKDVRFLMKWNGSLPDGFEGGFENLMVSDWLPQRELLRHGKLRGFITHGGLNSIQEATYYAVPLIVLPLFADQDYNAYRVEAQEVGFRLEIRDLTFDIMDKAVEKILSNPKYKKNMETRSKVFKDRPENPLNTIIYLTEFVLRHDLSALKPMSTHLNWFQLRSLDVYLPFLLILITIPLIIGIILMKLICCCCASDKTRPAKGKRKLKSS